jgi:hypothetical protein
MGNDVGREEKMKQLEKHIIVGVHITDRIEHVSRVQELFTEYGQRR